MEDKLIGKKFNNLTVLEYAYKKNSRHYYKCKCDCGKEIIVYKYHLLNGHTNSCGCYQKLRAKQTNTKHGKSHSRIDKIFQGMHDRCYNKNHDKYNYYGGKGVTICDEWLKDRTRFFDWAYNNGYADNLTINRIDGNKPYGPDNCRWVTRKVQSRNLSCNVYIEHNGEKKLLVEWCELFNIDYFTVLTRYNKHKYSFEEIFSKENLKSKGKSVREFTPDYKE